MNIIKHLFAAIGVILLAACENTDYMKFDTAHNGVYFPKDSMNYSFGVTPPEVESYTLKIPINVLGTVNHTDVREIAYELVSYSNLGKDTIAAVENKHFRISKAVVEPDSITGYLEIEIFRNTLEGTNKDGYKRYLLGVNLLKNSNFEPTLTKRQQSLILTFDNAVERPEWYDVKGNKIFPSNLYGAWHPYKLILMVDFYHQIKDAENGRYRNTYNEMVEMYGENMENLPNGQPDQHLYLFKKLVLKPTYDYLNDPANYDKIIADYPDFPFDGNGKSDFPDPYRQQ